MNIKQAREYYDLDILMSFYAVRDPMKKGWLLVIVGKEERSWTLETAMKKPKSFASLDTLVDEIESITGHISTLEFKI